MTSKLERFEKQISELRLSLEHKVKQISEMASHIELEKSKSTESVIDAQKMSEKLRNMKDEKDTEISELTTAHESLKTKSKKLLLSQKQLLTENKSLKNQLEGLSSNVKAWLTSFIHLKPHFQAFKCSIPITYSLQGLG